MNLHNFKEQTTTTSKITQKKYESSTCGFIYSQQFQTSISWQPVLPVWKSSEKSPHQCCFVNSFYAFINPFFVKSSFMAFLTHTFESHRNGQWRYWPLWTHARILNFCLNLPKTYEHTPRQHTLITIKL